MRLTTASVCRGVSSVDHQYFYSGFVAVTCPFRISIFGEKIGEQFIKRNRSIMRVVILSHKFTTRRET